MFFMGKPCPGKMVSPLAPARPPPEVGGAGDTLALPVRETPDNIVCTNQKLKPPHRRPNGSGGKHRYEGIGAVYPHHHIKGFPMKIEK